MPPRTTRARWPPPRRRRRRSPRRSRADDASAYGSDSGASVPGVDDVVVDDDDVGDEDRVRLIASSSSSRMNVASTPSNLSWSSSRTTALGLTRSMTERLVRGRSPACARCPRRKLASDATPVEVADPTHARGQVADDVAGPGWRGRTMRGRGARCAAALEPPWGEGRGSPSPRTPSARPRVSAPPILRPIMHHLRRRKSREKAKVRTTTHSRAARHGLRRRRSRRPRRDRRRAAAARRRRRGSVHRGASFRRDPAEGGPGGPMGHVPASASAGRRLGRAARGRLRTAPTRALVTCDPVARDRASCARNCPCGCSTTATTCSRL